jgi:multiple sugar transport system permease protein
MRFGRAVFRFVTAALAAWLVAWAAPARAGWIEARDDGTTVIHLTLWELPDERKTDAFTRAEVAAVKEFIRRFPKTFAERYRDRYRARPDVYGAYNWDRVEIELHQFSGIQVPGVETDLLAIAGGVSPDVLYVNFRKSDTYIRNEFLYPLDKPEDRYLTGMTEEEITFRIHPKIWPVIRRRGPDGAEQVWAIPWGGVVGKVLLYRRDLFDRHDVAFPDEHWTWTDMYKACRTITDPEEGVYGIRFGRGKHESWYWMTFLWSAGDEAMEYDAERDEWRCVFGSREAAVALEYYTRLCTERWVDADGDIHRGYAYKDTADAGHKWDRGEIGMMLAYIDEKLFATINPELTGMAPVPLGPTGLRGGELNSRMMGIFAGVENRVVRDAAWEYIRFYESKDAVRIKTRVMVEGGLGRFINPKYLRMFGYPEVERLAPKGWSRIFEIAIETGKPEPYGRNSNVAYDMMTFPIKEAEQLALDGALPKDREERIDVLHGILRKWNVRANDKMIGVVTPRERRWRNATAVAVLIAIVITFALVFRKIVRTFTPPQATLLTERQTRWGFRKYAWAYLLLIPAVLTILVWRYVPLARGSMMAFQDYRLLGDSQWVWVRNFGDLLWDSEWWRSVWNALRYSFLIMALTFLPPIILAVLLQEVPRGRLLFRTIYYLPAVITGLVTVLLWKQFYEESESGALNAIVLGIPAVVFVAVGLLLLLVALMFARRMLVHRMHLAAWLFVLAGILLLVTCAGLAEPILVRGEESLGEILAHLPKRLFETTPEPYRWLGDSSTAMIACVIPMVWAGVGPGCLIYLAALKGIPDELYEAADVDGAGFIDKILFVVFPILKPLILINFIGVFIRSWYGATGRILAMTAGDGNTEVAGLHIFYKAFIFLEFGPATAMAWVLAFMLIGFTVHQLRILSRLEFRTTGDKG